MQYKNICEGRFLSRPNRFAAEVQIQDKIEICHVKNTGRCRELLIPGAKVYLEESDNEKRKTKYDLVAVEKGERLINMDSQLPNAAVKEWILQGGLFMDLTYIRGEKVFGESRFDLYAEHGEKKAFIEVKGVTLEQDGIARFPDAPTLRGVKHVEELCRCVEQGYEAYLIFVIQMKGITRLEPNWTTHPQFGEAMQKAAKSGVKLLAYDCIVKPSGIWIDQPVPVVLE